MLRPQESRILGLDIVRSIAIFLVLWAHSTYVFPKKTASLLESLFPVDLGVPIFFVLSGYLIGGILLRTIDTTEFSAGDLGQFWIRRWFRTLPNYFLIVGFLWLYDVWIYRVDSQFSWRYLLFSQNLSGPNPDFFPEGWSLSIEEWFYVSFPLCCFLGSRMTRNRRRMILILACVFVFVPTALRLGVCISEPYADIWLLNHTVIYRFDGLMYGVLGAYVYRYKPAVWYSVRFKGIMMSVVLFVFLFIGKTWLTNMPFGFVFYHSMASAATLVALPYFSMLKKIRSRNWTRFFTFVSVTSYAMYVLNLSVIQWRLIPAFFSVTGLKELLGENGAAILGFFLFWPSVIIGAYLLYRYFEVPWMNLRDRIKYSAAKVEEQTGP